MSQQTGETRDAIIGDVNDNVQAILSENEHRTDPYWIVIFAKPAKGQFEGKPTLVQHVKAYSTRPTSQVGMIIGEVNNHKGTVDWEVNMPQRPFDFDALAHAVGSEAKTEVITETSSISSSYITK